MGKTGGWRLTALCMAMALLVGSMLLVAGCGEKAAEQKIEREIEKALESEGADVDVDISDDDSGSITISGEDGDAEISFGGAADVPDDFPKELLPDDADVLSVMDMSEGDEIMQTVTFTSDADLDEMYEWFLEALPDAGYEIGHKMQFDSDDEEAFSIMGSGSGTGCNVNGAKTDDGYTYSVMIGSE